MNKVLIIGDKPSKKNIKQDVPFVGTRSWVTLLSWLEFLKLNDFEITNIPSKQELDNLIVELKKGYKDPVSDQQLVKFFFLHKYAGYKIIVLGNNAEKFVNEYMWYNHYFKLPHPSGRNRLLNNKELVDSLLKQCYNYLHNEDKGY